MKRALVRTSLALALVLSGWAVGRAQTTQADFELAVVAPAGQTTITCTRGCSLQWTERGRAERQSGTPFFRYSCNGAECKSGAISGFVIP